MRVSDRGANGDHLKQADSELLGVAGPQVLGSSHRGRTTKPRGQFVDGTHT